MSSDERLTPPDAVAMLRVIGFSAAEAEAWLASCPKPRPCPSNIATLRQAKARLRLAYSRPVEVA